MSTGARWATRFATLSVILFAGGPLLAHFYILAPLAGFGMFALGGLLGIVILIVSSIVALRTGLSAVRNAMMLSALTTAAFVISALPGRSVPRINDITTDVNAPPQLLHAASLPANQGRDLRYPGAEFAAQQQAGYPALAPLHLAATPDDTFKRVAATARQMQGWEITNVNTQRRSLEGTATSGLFRFVDDFAIEVRPDANGSVIQMRSKSRDGKGDVGANAARIEAFFQRLSETP